MAQFIEVEMIIKEREKETENLPFRVITDVQEEEPRKEQKHRFLKALVDVDRIVLATRPENGADLTLLDCGEFNLLLNETYNHFKERFLTLIGQPICDYVYTNKTTSTN